MNSNKVTLISRSPFCFYNMAVNIANNILWNNTVVCAYLNTYLNCLRFTHHDSWLEWWYVLWNMIKFLWIIFLYDGHLRKLPSRAAEDKYSDCKWFFASTRQSLRYSTLKISTITWERFYHKQQWYHGHHRHFVVTKWPLKWPTVCHWGMQPLKVSKQCLAIL